jgi:hypothetical protein
MMKNPLMQIKESLITLLKGLDPDVDVFFEEIRGTDKTRMEKPRTYYFVEIVPNINTTVDKYFTDKGVLVDVAYHEERESNTAYLIKAAELDGTIRPVFSFGDRKITVPEANIKVVDHVLHFSFIISFRQSEEETSEFAKMGELEVAVRKGE